MSLTAEDERMIERMRAKLDEARRAVQNIQTAIRVIYQISGEDPPDELFAFGGSEDRGAAANSRPANRYGPTEFYGKPLAWVVRRILQDRNHATDADLYQTMTDGGFKFDQGKPDEARAYLRLTLGKNPGFAKTPQGLYLLRADPPKAKKAKKSVGEKPVTGAVGTGDSTEGTEVPDLEASVTSVEGDQT